MTNTWSSYRRFVFTAIMTSRTPCKPELKIISKSNIVFLINFCMGSTELQRGKRSLHNFELFQSKTSDAIFII